MIRAKITPTWSEDLVHIVIEWIRVENETPGEVVYTESFSMTKERMGVSAYVTKGMANVFDDQPNTFWLDENGNRHFVLHVDPATLFSEGQNAG